MTADCAQLRLALGAYVLGALEPAERAQLEVHLADCPACREELSGFAGLPGLLSRIGAEEAASLGTIEAGPALVDRTLAELHGRRRMHRRRRVALTAAAAVLVAAGAGGIAVSVSPDRAGPATNSVGSPAGRVSGADATTGVRATATLHAAEWGTAIALNLSGVTPNERCQLVAIGRDGHREVAGTWHASYEGQAGVTAATAIARPQLAALEVDTVGGARLVALPVPSDGAKG